MKKVIEIRWKTDVSKIHNNDNDRIGSSHVESTGSDQVTKVKKRQACFIFGWVTAVTVNKLVLGESPWRYDSRTGLQNCCKRFRTFVILLRSLSD